MARPTDLDVTFTSDTNSDPVYHPGGTGSFNVVGTFDSIVVTLFADFGTGEFRLVTGVTLAVEGTITYSLPQCILRLTTTAAGTSEVRCSLRAHHDV